jgi:hypothetical protein
MLLDEASTGSEDSIEVVRAGVSLIALKVARADVPLSQRRRASA